MSVHKGWGQAGVLERGREDSRHHPSELGGSVPSQPGLRVCVSHRHPAAMGQARAEEESGAGPGGGTGQALLL